MKGFSISILLVIGCSMNLAFAISTSKSCSCVNGVCDCDSSVDKQGNVAGASSFVSSDSGRDPLWYNRALTGSSNTGNMNVQSSQSGGGSDYGARPFYGPAATGMSFGGAVGQGGQGGVAVATNIGVASNPHGSANSGQGNRNVREPQARDINYVDYGWGPSYESYGQDATGVGFSGVFSGGGVSVATNIGVGSNSAGAANRGPGSTGVQTAVSVNSGNAAPPNGGPVYPIEVPLPSIAMQYVPRFVPGVHFFSADGPNAYSGGGAYPGAGAYSGAGAYAGAGAGAFAGANIPFGAFAMAGKRK